MKGIHKLLLVTASVVLLCTGCIQSERTDNVTVFIVGDSTACNYNEKQAPRAGWGQVINTLFNDSVTVVNKAASGRSSKSFIEEGKFNFIDDMKKGDYLFIQFGHNDEKIEDSKRYTNPATTFKEYLSIYIDEAQKKGVYPVLITPVNRRSFDSNGKIKPSHGQYPDAIIQLAAEKGIPVIDITEKSKILFEALGEEKTKNIFLFLKKGENPNYPDGVEDNTHFAESGAVEISKLVIEGIKENKLPLEKYIK